MGRIFAKPGITTLPVPSAFARQENARDLRDGPTAASCL
jgi:hypothetical protein